eukprot:scaffold8401_cov74-Phaeocystis_antarctica.AAC.2
MKRNSGRSTLHRTVVESTDMHSRRLTAPAMLGGSVDVRPMSCGRSKPEAPSSAKRDCNTSCNKASDEL